MHALRVAPTTTLTGSFTLTLAFALAVTVVVVARPALIESLTEAVAVALTWLTGCKSGFRSKGIVVFLLLFG